MRTKARAVHGFDIRMRTGVIELRADSIEDVALLTTLYHHFAGIDNRDGDLTLPKLAQLLKSEGRPVTAVTGRTDVDRERCTNCVNGIQRCDDGFAFICGSCGGEGWVYGSAAEMVRSIRAEMEAPPSHTPGDTKISPHAFQRKGWRFWICQHCYAPRSLHPRKGWIKARALQDNYYLSPDATHFREGW